jgi:hypothetical protein
MVNYTTELDRASCYDTAPVNAAKTPSQRNTVVEDGILLDTACISYTDPNDTNLNINLRSFLSYEGRIT